MWNPERYTDTDYGLAADEPFEPVEGGDDNYTPEQGEPYIQTVLGPIAPDEAGIALVHEHLIATPRSAGADEDDNQLSDRRAALVDLETFFTVGGRTVVDATIASAGRSAETLAWLAARAPIHIVAAAGIDLREDAVGTDSLASLGKEMDEGLDGTCVKPGVLSMALGGEANAGRNRSSLARMAVHHQQFGLPVMLHASVEDGTARCVSAVIEAGLSPERLIVGGLAGLADSSQLRELASLGTYLLFDGLGDDQRGADNHAATLVAGLVQSGYREKVLLSHSYARRPLLTGYEGRPGYGYIIEQFAIMLVEAGVSPEDVRVMLVENSASALSIRPHDAGLDA